MSAFNLASVLAHHAARYPDRPCLVWADQVITYADLDRRAARTAGGLAKLGIGRGDVVAVVLYNCPEFLEAAVVGRADPRWGEVPVAFVVLREGLQASADELQEFCRGRLAKFKVPKDVHVVEVLPRNPSGKVLKRDLREQARALAGLA